MFEIHETKRPVGILISYAGNMDTTAEMVEKRLGEILRNPDLAKEIMTHGEIEGTPQYQMNIMVRKSAYKYLYGKLLEAVKERARRHIDAEIERLRAQMETIQGEMEALYRQKMDI